MSGKLFYVDSCIWLNLFKKEKSASNGGPHWKIADDFIKRVKDESCAILVSPMVLREISFKLKDKMELVNEFFRINEYIELISVIPDDYSFARKVESESYFEISFYDCLHIAICKRLQSMLITRDRELISVARTYISVSKPEELLN